MMDQAIRNKLRSVVTQCRRLLEESIAQQLQGKFDIYATGKKDEVRAEEVVPLGHLTAEEQQDRKDILAHFKHVEALGYKPRESLEQMIREIAFTHLNRFCAYKMMEVRDVYVGGQRFREAVSKGLKSQGFLFYRAENPEEERLFKAGEQEEVYRHFLNWLGGTLSQEIGVLFSPTDPANRVYPPQRVLEAVFDLLNSEELKAIWAEDETIGWVYQYFTPKELRDQARKASQAPRNSYELAFRNQFFTPRYVVEFLTDNTLGRIWYEMRQGDTRLKDECRYLVRRPTEVFLRDPDRPLATPPRADWVRAAARGEFSNLPDEPEIDDLSDFALIHDGYILARHLGYDDPHDLAKSWLDSEGSEPSLPTSTSELWIILFGFQRRWSHAADSLGDGFFDRWKAVYRAFRDQIGRTDIPQEEQLHQAIYVPHRPKKDPREIKILDPACGSGHFLLYCFVLLLVIYEESYEDTELGPRLQGDYPTKDDLRRAVPGLILRHNLHGIDIDLRCTQIAALALWLRCQRAYQELGFRKDRPRITKSNIVCAEPMPGEEDYLKQFLEGLTATQVERVLHKVLPYNTQQVPEVPEELALRLRAWVRCVWEDMRSAGDAGSLLQMLGVEPHLQQIIQDEYEWWYNSLFYKQVIPSLGESPPVANDRGVKIVLELLKAYVTDRFKESAFTSVLFCQDTVRGVAFLDVCRQRYDVVLMNPPFGSPSRLGKPYIEKHYPRTKGDLYAAFVERGLRLLERTGLLGAITSRTGFFLSSFQKWREEILLSEAFPTVFADLGYGVLDTATVETAAYCVQAGKSPDIIPFARLIDQSNKSQELAESVSAMNTLIVNSNNFFIGGSSLRQLPGSPFAYWTPAIVFSLFEESTRFENASRHVRCGMGTLDDFRFLRLWWEVSAASVGRSRDATRMGAKWIPFAKGGTASSYYAPIPLVVNYFDDGVELKSYVREKVGSETRKVQAQSYYFRPGITFGRRIRKFSPACLPSGCIFSDSSNTVFLSDDINADLAAHLGLLNGSVIRGLLSLFVPLRKMEVGYLQRLPFGSDESIDKTILQDAAAASIICAKLRMEEFSTDETDYMFHPLQLSIGRLQEVAERVRARRVAIGQEINDRADRLDELAGNYYGLTTLQRKKIEALAQVNSPIPDNIDDEELTEEVDSVEHSISDFDFTADLCSFAFGCLFGRWDLRMATSPERRFEAPSPFDELPIVSHGMLCTEGGLPAFDSPVGYPFQINWDGILVDDPDHPDDIIRRVRDVLEVIWKDRADATEKEACEILSVADLRDYFRKPGAGGFWDDHIKRYSKSRRKAPIYWLLQSSKKNYALWIYYHRLDKDILFKALLNYVEPKIRKEESHLDELRSQKTALGPDAKGAKKFDKDIDRQEAFVSELRDFEDKIRRTANLHIDPDLGDGVVLNIAPLRELVPWKEAKSYWDDLMDGEYEWSSIGKQLREKGVVK